MFDGGGRAPRRQGSLPDLFMEEERHCVDHRLDESNAAGDRDRPCEEIRDPESDREVDKQVRNRLRKIDVSLNRRRHEFLRYLVPSAASSKRLRHFGRLIDVLGAAFIIAGNQACARARPEIRTRR